MKEIILGTEGDQPFKIASSGVSHRHAKVTIDDDNTWRLEDLNSTNGTFVRGSDGTMQRVANVMFYEMSFIRLVPANVNGCCFYARQLLSPKSYTKEFRYLNDLEDKYEAMEQKEEILQKVTRKVVGIVSFVAFGLSFFVSGKLQIYMLRAGSVMSFLSSILFDFTSRKKRIVKARERLYQCPNPGCSHVLTAKEVRSMQCPKCKAH